MEDYGSGKEAEEGQKRRGQNLEFDRANSKKRELEKTFNKMNKNDFFF